MVLKNFTSPRVHPWVYKIFHHQGSTLGFPDFCHPRVPLGLGSFTSPKGPNFCFSFLVWEILRHQGFSLDFAGFCLLRVLLGFKRFDFTSPRAHPWICMFFVTHNPLWVYQIFIIKGPPLGFQVSHQPRFPPWFRKIWCHQGSPFGFGWFYVTQGSPFVFHQCFVTQGSLLWFKHFFIIKGPLLGFASFLLPKGPPLDLEDFLPPRVPPLI